MAVLIAIIVGLALLALILLFVFQYWGEGTGWFGGIFDTVGNQAAGVS